MNNAHRYAQNCKNLFIKPGYGSKVGSTRNEQKIPEIFFS